jgi:hypothetical protein
MQRAIRTWRQRVPLSVTRLSLAQRFMLASLVILVAGMLGVDSWVANRIDAGVI